MVLSMVVTIIFLLLSGVLFFAGIHLIPPMIIGILFSVINVLCIVCFIKKKCPFVLGIMSKLLMIFLTIMIGLHLTEL